MAAMFQQLMHQLDVKLDAALAPMSSHVDRLTLQMEGFQNSPAPAEEEMFSDAGEEEKEIDDEGFAVPKGKGRRKGPSIRGKAGPYT